MEASLKRSSTLFVSVRATHYHKEKGLRCAVVEVAGAGHHVDDLAYPRRDTTLMRKVIILILPNTTILNSIKSIANTLQGILRSGNA